MYLHPGLYALISIGLALLVFAVLHHRKFKIGQAMLLSAVFLALMLWVSPLAWWQTLVREWHTGKLGESTPFLFITLTSLVLLVNVLGSAMQETGVSARLVPALRHLFRSRRAVLAGIPFLMGMLPTPGGIMLSAPMVRELGDATGVKRDLQAAINFFFRHQLETVWPLFPAVPLIQVMLQIPPERLLAYNLIISLSGLGAGAVFLLLPRFPAATPMPAGPRPAWTSNLRDFAHAFWPIALTAVLYTLFHVPAALGILAAILAFLAVHHVPRSRWLRLFAAAMEWDFALLILGALLYKLNLDSASAVPDISSYLEGRHVPIPVLVFGLPFLVAFVTGVTMPTVAMTFPVLKAFIGSGPTVHMELEVLAFAGVVVGLFLTPVHLCLALSASYFEVSLGRILRLVLLPALAVTAIVFLFAFV
jgi:integral membrane protein (TIGR00529 family)